MGNYFFRVGKGERYFELQFDTENELESGLELFLKLVHSTGSPMNAIEVCSDKTKQLAAAGDSRFEVI